MADLRAGLTHALGYQSRKRTAQRIGGLGALLGIALGVSCGSPEGRSVRGSRSSAANVGNAATTSLQAVRNDPPPDPKVVEGADTATVAEAIDPPNLPPGALAAWQPPPGEPAELTAIKQDILRGELATRTLKALQKLTHKYPKNEELAYLLGQLYFTKLWVGDGLKAFRNAIQLNPMYRENSFLLRAAISGLGNDSDYSQVRRFLIQDVGHPAAPYLEEVLYSDWRAQVKERAAAVLREVP